MSDQIPWSTPVGVEIEIRSSDRAASSLNHWASLSPASPIKLSKAVVCFTCGGHSYYRKVKVSWPHCSLIMLWFMLLGHHAVQEQILCILEPPEKDQVRSSSKESFNLSVSKHCPWLSNLHIDSHLATGEPPEKWAVKQAYHPTVMWTPRMYWHKSKW